MIEICYNVQCLAKLNQLCGYDTDLSALALPLLFQMTPYIYVHWRIDIFLVERARPLGSGPFTFGISEHFKQHAGNKTHNNAAPTTL